MPLDPAYKAGSRGMKPVNLELRNSRRKKIKSLFPGFRIKGYFLGCIAAIYPATAPTSAAARRCCLPAEVFTKAGLFVLSLRRNARWLLPFLLPFLKGNYPLFRHFAAGPRPWHSMWPAACCPRSTRRTISRLTPGQRSSSWATENSPVNCWITAWT